MKRLAVLILAMALMVPAGMAQEKQKKEKTRKNLPSPLAEVWGGMGIGTVLKKTGQFFYLLGKIRILADNGEE